jgi:anti-sigma regulatory factor (Ser/Thr protein kinase)
MASQQGRSHVDIAIAGNPESVAQARGAAREFLRHADREELTADAAVVVSELVTNALRYAPGPIRLNLRWRAGLLQIEVHDTSPERPSARDAPSALERNGRGLIIVNALAREWGSRLSPRGKVTWAHLG